MKTVATFRPPQRKKKRKKKRGGSPAQHYGPGGMFRSPSSAKPELSIKEQMVDAYRTDIRRSAPRTTHHPFAHKAHPHREKYIAQASKDLEHKPDIKISGPFDMNKSVMDNLPRYKRLYVLSRPDGGMEEMLRDPKDLNMKHVAMFLARDKANGNLIVGWSLCAEMTLVVAGGYFGGIEGMPGNPVESIVKLNNLRGPKAALEARSGHYVGVLQVNVDIRYRGLHIGGMLAARAKGYADLHKLYPVAGPADKLGASMYRNVGAVVDDSNLKKVASVREQTTQLLLKALSC